MFLTVDQEMSTLQDFRRRPHRTAEHGTHGQADLRHGRKGSDLVLSVPAGTMVLDEDSCLIADLITEDHRVMVLKGGRGGRGNAALVSVANPAPSFCEQGEYGRDSWFTLELKLIADAALVGFPNAGKSTLLSRVSAARPKISDYPFTTLIPNLGVVEVDDRSFVLVDVPGLIEGASEGKGLGHRFLRHCERVRVMVFLLDPSPLQELSPEQQYKVLKRELAAHDPDLLDRPEVVAVTKRDLFLETPLTSARREAIPDPVEISSVTGQGINELVRRIAVAVGQAERSVDLDEGYILHRPLGSGFSVDREGSTWIVTGRAAERAVAVNDLTSPEAALAVARRIARLGIDEALRRVGAQKGDEVQIGDLVFEYSVPDDE